MGSGGLKWGGLSLRSFDLFDNFCLRIYVLRDDFVPCIEQTISHCQNDQDRSQLCN